LFVVSFLRQAVRNAVFFIVSFHRNALSRRISLLSVVEEAPDGLTISFRLQLAELSQLAQRFSGHLAQPATVLITRPSAARKLLGTHRYDIYLH
jgi:hypothetical protein